MSSNPSSTRATHGSASSTYSSSIPESTTSSKSEIDPTSATNDDSHSTSSARSSVEFSQEEQPYDRIHSYLADSVDTLPQYDDLSLEDSVQIHTSQMKAYLDSFDATMARYEG